MTRKKKIVRAEDLEIIQEMETTNSNISATMARLTDVESLPEAFKDCRGVFHTSSFIDPTGVSGYTVITALSTVKCSIKFFFF